MDPRDRTIEELVEHYMANPGSAETDQLDFKAKEKVETTEGKRDITKKAAAIANTDGGTIVVGVGEGGRDDIIQSFGSRSEIKRDLWHVFRDNTKPPLDQRTEIRIEESPLGARLLRIDIQPAETYPIEFYDRDSGEFVAYHRVGDTTREMETSDIVEFTKRRTQGSSGRRSELTKIVTIETSDIEIHDDSEPRESPDNRAILNIDQHGLVVPAMTSLNNPHYKSLTFHMEKRAGDSGISALTELLGEIEEELNADLGFEFGYGIKYGDREIIGRNADNYIYDIQNLEDTLRLLGWEEDDNDPRPVAIGGTRCDFGFVWVQAQYHTGTLSRIKCGLMMSDIPLNTGTLSRVFGDKWFEQNNLLRGIKVRLRGEEVPLANPREVLLDQSSDSGRTEIIADNPYYRNEEAILEATDEDVSEFISAISAVDRLPFDVRGGYTSEDVYYSVGEIELTYIRTVVPTYFVWPICDPHVEAPSEEPPTPDWVDSLWLKREVRIPTNPPRLSSVLAGGPNKSDGQCRRLS